MMWLTGFCVTSYATGLGYIVSAMFNNFNSATAAAPLFSLPVMLFGGLFANAGTIPAYLSWIQYLSGIRYAFECLVRANWPDDTDEGKEILESLGFDIGYWKCIIALLILAFVFRCISFVVVKSKVGKFQ